MSNLNLWLNEKIEICTIGNINHFGEYEVISRKKTKGKVQEEIKLITDAKGNDVVLTATIFLKPKEDIKVEDRILIYENNEVVKDYKVVGKILRKDNKGRAKFLSILVSGGVVDGT